MRTAIDCLPADTRRAMLEGIRRQPVVVGAYTDNRGGACPMLAAHRAGSRVSFLSFARSWDRFTRAVRPRRATQREVKILRNQLEASLLAEDATDLGAAISEHRELMRKRAAQAPLIAAERSAAKSRPGDADRRKELGRRAGWAWLRPVRTLEDYQRALVLADAQLALVESAREEHPELV